MFTMKTPNTMRLHGNIISIFLKHNIKMHLSTIVISEFHQKQTIVELLKTGQYIVEPYNVEDAVATADLTFKLGNSERRGDAKAEFKDDIKLMGQARKQRP